MKKVKFKHDEILILDSQGYLRMYAETVLKQMLPNWHIKNFTNVKDISVYCASVRPSFILTEYYMTDDYGLNVAGAGLEFACFLKQIEHLRTVPVIIECETLQDRRKILDNKFISFDRSERTMHDVIREALEQREAQSRA